MVVRATISRRNEKMTIEEDKLRAFNACLRDCIVEIKKVATKHPDENTNKIVSMIDFTLYMTS